MTFNNDLRNPASELFKNTAQLVTDNVSAYVFLLLGLLVFDLKKMSAKSILFVNFTDVHITDTNPYVCNL